MITLTLMKGGYRSEKNYDNNNCHGINCYVFIWCVACGNTEVKVEPSATPEPTPSATPEPTPEPTPTQTPEPTPEPQGPGLVAESEKVDQSYFDDTAFVGDSVSLKLNYYNVSSGSLGKAQFFTAGSLGCANALWEVSDKSVHHSYQGEKMLRRGLRCEVRLRKSSISCSE